MTFRVTIGCDPGISGALAVVADGVPAAFIDMPTKPRPDGGNELDGGELAARLRGIMHEHVGADIRAALEWVNSMPTDGAKQAFRFGESSGGLRCVLEAVGIPVTRVRPGDWKRFFGMLKQDKDVARLRAIEAYPDAAEALKRKKDGGRADALWVALWAIETQQL